MKTFEINGEVKTLHEWHMELWNWLSSNPEKYKKDWMVIVKCSFDERPLNNCFACESGKKFV